jgi:hypothetical protein
VRTVGFVAVVLGCTGDAFALESKVKKDKHNTSSERGHECVSRMQLPFNDVAFRVWKKLFILVVVVVEVNVTSCPKGFKLICR